MTNEDFIARATGNHRDVFVIRTTSVGMRRDSRGNYTAPKVLGYSLEVCYLDRPELNFSEHYATKARAMQAFKTWKTITN